MKRKLIPVEASFTEWKKDPKYAAAYASLEEEFALASSLIKARSEADMTQAQGAQAMGTTQTVVARLESGKAQPLHPHLKALRQSHPLPPAHRLRTPPQSHALRVTPRKPRSDA